MKKKLTARLLAVVMCMTLCIPAFATESDPVFTGPYAELKASVYQQLKAQNKLEHFELHLAALNLVEDETASVYSTSADAMTWNAPNGGVLTYAYDWTYRGESGYVATTTTYMNVAQTNAYRSNKHESLFKLIEAVTGIAIDKLAEKISLFESMKKEVLAIYSTLNIIGLAEDALVEASINDADGYSKLSAVYDSISDGYSKVLIGWDTHPTVTLDWPDAYNVSFNYS